jgi:hypothetical protein
MYSVFVKKQTSGQTMNPKCLLSFFWNNSFCSCSVGIHIMCMKSRYTTQSAGVSPHLPTDFAWFCNTGQAGFQTSHVMTGRNKNMKLVSADTILLLGGTVWPPNNLRNLGPRYLFSATPPMMTDVQELATQQAAWFLLTTRTFNQGQLSCMVPPHLPRWIPQ